MGVKHYDKAFKEQVLRLIEKRGNLSQVSQELGVSSSQLARWRRESEKFGEHSFSGRGVERLINEQRRIT